MNAHPPGNALLWFDWLEYDTVSAAVIDAVGSVSDQDTTEMPPLYESVDPDALDALFSRSRSIDDPQSVQFEFNGHHVRVENDGDGHVLR